jgi:hypothetical protein
MKNFFKKIPFSDPPFSDAIYGAAFIVILLVLGLINGIETLQLLASTIVFFLIMLSGIAVLFLWQRKTASAWWYAYSLILVVAFFGYIPIIINEAAAGFPVWDDLLYFISSAISTLFVVMVLIGKYWFTRKFWQWFFVLELALPLLIVWSSQFGIFGAGKLSKPELAIALVLYVAFLFPYYLTLYEYSFGRTSKQHVMTTD